MIRSLILCRRIYSHLLDTKANFVLPLTHSFEPCLNGTNGKPNSYKIQSLTTESTDQRTASDIYKPATRFINFLHDKLNCSKEEAMQLCIDHPELIDCKTKDAIQNIELLLSANVRPDVILDNPKIMKLSHSQISANLEIVKEMQPKNINDFIPLVQVSTGKLVKLKRHAKSEENIVPKKHRIYYMSETMNIEPCIVTKFISKRWFILDIPFETLDKTLGLLLKYIAPMDILNDLWAFRYSLAQIEYRLIQAQQGQKKKLMPWMIRCPEEKLLNSIKITADQKAIVGNDTTVKYLAERLRHSISATEAIMKKHPQVYNVRVTQIKTVLDYLLGEAGFTETEIANTPRIFCHSLTTTKKRLDELKSMGCRPLSLAIVCKSSNEYNKFVRNWTNKHENLRNSNIIEE